MTVKQKRFILWTSVVLWMLLIFWFSSQNSDESSAMSGGIVGFIMNVIRYIFSGMSSEKISIVEDNLVFIVRKTAHASIYFGLGVLVFFAMNTVKSKKGFKIIIATAICFLYAASDEFHQRFVPGRSCEFRDMCIDLGGAVVGIITVVLLQWIIDKRSKKRQREQ